MSRNNINESSTQGGVDEFIELLDVPNSYLGQAGKFPVVNVNETGLDFINTVAPPSVNEFILLSDCPPNYGSNLTFLNGNTSTNSTQWIQPKIIGMADMQSNYGTAGQYIQSNGSGFILSNGSSVINKFIELVDCPSNYGTNLTFLNGNSSSNLTQWIQPTFINLGDTPASYSGVNTNSLVVKDTGNSLTFVDLDVLAGTSLSLINLNDVQSNYGTNGQVLTSNGAGFYLSNIAPISGETLITLNDYSGNAYASGDLGKIVQVNTTNNGFLFTNSLFTQQLTMYLNYGMIKKYNTYPTNKTFVYDDSDSEGGYFYFATYRINYGIPDTFLNDYWTTKNPSGVSKYLDGNSLDIYQNVIFGCKTASAVIENLLIPSGYSTWYADLKIDFSFTIDLGNIDANLFVIWIQHKDTMINWMANESYEQQVANADYWFCNKSGVSTAPSSIASGHISKIITVPLNVKYPIEVFMSCRLSNNYQEKGSFTIRSYDYINMHAQVIGMHPPSTIATVPPTSFF